MTSHNPNPDIYTDAANALPGVLSEALGCARPGIAELLPALPDQLARGSITGVRGKVLQSPGGSTTQGTQLDQWSDTTSKQQWQLLAV